jgi:DNA-binding transcriptional MerR regulator
MAACGSNFHRPFMDEHIYNSRETTMDTDTFTISDLAREFDISSRSIRFYEEKGLISPQRTPGNQRRYTLSDKHRLKWILRGKRFGYSLDEIARMLGLVDAKMKAADQIRATLSYGEKKLKDIENRIDELEIMRAEMLDLKNKLLKRLSELEQHHSD